MSIIKLQFVPGSTVSSERGDYYKARFSSADGTVKVMLNVVGSMVGKPYLYVDTKYIDSL